MRSPFLCLHQPFIRKTFDANGRPVYPAANKPAEGASPLNNAHRSQSQDSHKANKPASASAADVDQGSWASVARKLRAIREEFEANNTVLQRLRGDVLDSIVQAGITEDMLDRSRSRSRTPTSRASSNHQSDPTQDSTTRKALSSKRESLSRCISSVDGRITEELESALATGSGLRIDVHIEQVSEFIGDQHVEVEALRKLQSGLLAQGRAPQETLQQLDALAYASLLQFFDRDRSHEASHQDKLKYLVRLIAYTDKLATNPSN